MGEGCSGTVEDEVEREDEITGDVRNEVGYQGEVDSQEEYDNFTCAPCIDGADESTEGIDGEVEVEAEMQRAAADPGQPSPREKEEHELTHFPP